VSLGSPIGPPEARAHLLQQSGYGAIVTPLCNGCLLPGGTRKVRGLLDVLVGGPGLRRGRRNPVGLKVGDTVDFWRVEAFEPGRLLRLSAEMKVPGRAWLQAC